MKTDHVLEGVYAKLDRARVHATELRALIETSLRNAGGFEAQPGDHPHELVFVASGIPHIDPGWGAILGDFLTNLRAALDHLAWQLVQLSGGVPDRRTAFPIRVPKRDRATPAPVKIKGLTPELLAEVEGLQPDTYCRLYGGEPENNGLYILNELVNFDKHRLLLVMAAQISATGPWWYVTDDRPGPTGRPAAGPLANGAIAARFDFLDRPPPAAFEPHLEYTIVLGDGPNLPAIRRVSLTALMSRLYFDVEHMAVGPMAHHFGLGHRPVPSVYPL